MSSDTITSFLTYYIRDLFERTREEKAGTKFGFDWTIYNLALADDLVPHRLPFLRAGGDQTSKTKTEPEFGVDLAFLSSDGSILTVFVLKDEVLNNANWTKHNFDSDLRKAATPSLASEGLRDVRDVHVILAYNKDEDRTGVTLFENCTTSLGTKVGDNASLRFERWNLTSIVEKVKASLLTPSLLPQRHFSLFSYICSQFSDFSHGSSEWHQQLEPNWRRFLDDLFAGSTDHRTLRLLPVALIILREHGKSNSSSETGWIDLMEWSVLKAWEVFKQTNDETSKSLVFQIWTSFYLAELDRYYSSHAEELATEDSLSLRASNGSLGAIAASVIAHWHIARTGLLAMGYFEILPRSTEKEQSERHRVVHGISNRLASLLNANPSSKRPLIDLHHIELFLVWRTLWQVNRKADIYHWLSEIANRLTARRAGLVPVPFLEGRNSMEFLLEYVARGQRPPEYCDESSFLLLMLLELCLCLPEEERNEILLSLSRLIHGHDVNGEPFPNTKPIVLMGWEPPADWESKYLSKCLASEGEAITLNAFKGKSGDEIKDEILEYVEKSRSISNFELPSDMPRSVLILACLKHRSPLPPELWRKTIFGVKTKKPEGTDGTVS